MNSSSKLNPFANEFVPSWQQTAPEANKKYLQALLTKPESSLDSDRGCDQQVQPGNESKKVTRQHIARVVTSTCSKAQSRWGMRWLEISRSRAEIINFEDQQRTKSFSSDAASVAAGGWFSVLGPQSNTYCQQAVPNSALIAQEDYVSTAIAQKESYVATSKPKHCTWWLVVSEGNVAEIIRMIRAGFQWDCSFDPSHLTDASIDVGAMNTVMNGMNVLQLYAYRERYSLALSQLLDEVASLRANIDYRDRRSTNKRTPLHLACEASNFNAVKTLVTNGASLVARDKFGDSPLHIAVRNGASHSLIAYLCEHNRQAVNMRNKRLETPLMLGTRRDIALTLINAGANLIGCNVDGYDVITLAVMRDNFSLLETIVLSNGNTKHHRQCRQPLLPYHSRASNRQQQTVTSALHQSVKRQNQRAVQLLLNSGRFSLQELNETDRPYFYTPLMYAAESGNVDIFLLLLRNGADPAIEDLKGNTALAIAALNKHTMFLRQIAAAVDERISQALFSHINFRSESILYLVASSISSARCLAVNANFDDSIEVLICLLQNGCPFDGAVLQQHLCGDVMRNVLKCYVKFDTPLSQWKHGLQQLYITNELFPPKRKESRWHILGECDVFILLEDGQEVLKAHACVLRERGGALLPMLDSNVGTATKSSIDDRTNSRQYHLNLQHLHVSTFSIVLNWLYTDSIDADDLDVPIIIDLLLTANELLLNELQFRCELLFCRCLQKSESSGDVNNCATIDDATQLTELINADIVSAYVQFLMEQERGYQNSKATLPGCSSGGNPLRRSNRVVHFLQQLVTKVPDSHDLSDYHLLETQVKNSLTQLFVAFIVECESDVINELDGGDMNCETLFTTAQNLADAQEGEKSVNGSVTRIQIQRLCGQLLTKVIAFNENLGFVAWILQRLVEILQPSSVLLQKHNTRYRLDNAVQQRLLHRHISGSEAKIGMAIRHLIHEQHLLFSLWEATKEGSYSSCSNDVLLRIEGNTPGDLRSWRCHKATLSRCPKFAAMLHFRDAQFLADSLAENKDSGEHPQQLELDVTATSAEAMEVILTFIYTGAILDVNNISGIDDEGGVTFLLELLRVADEYLLDDFCVELQALLVAKLDSTNALSLYFSLVPSQLYPEVLSVVVLFLLKECSVLHRPRSKLLLGKKGASKSCVQSTALSTASLILLNPDEYEQLLRELLLTSLEI